MTKPSNANATMKGNYTYIGIDIDTTGRRLIDEIVNIAAYTSNGQFSQHIMPLMNLNPGARQKHQIRVINVGCFRMLKSLQTYKVIKTKTEIAALLDFLDWLEEVNTKDGVIFLYHDTQKFTPFMVIEAMKKYRLMDRFQKTVKAFVNGYDLATEALGGNGIKYLLLAQNRKIQEEKLGMTPTEESLFEGDATVRAKLSYEIVMLMAHGGEKKELDQKEMENLVNNFVREKAMPISNELEEISEQEECIARQSTLREVFRGYFQASRYHRRRAVNFRRILADAKYDLDSLKAIWDEGKREAIQAKINELEELKEKEEDQTELADILDSHFDPEKKTVRPVVQRRESVSQGNGMQQRNNNQQRRRRGPRGRSMNKENHGPRQNSHRRNKSTEKRFNNNNNNKNDNNNNMMANKQMQKEQHQQQQQQVDSNVTIMVGAH